MNKLYGMLVDAPDSAEFYYRNTDQAGSMEPAVLVLVPQSADKAYKQYCADQLCRLCLDVFPGKLAELDTQASYSYPSLAATEKLTEVKGTPDTVQATVFDLQLGYPFIEKTMSLSYDGVDTFVFEGKTYPWNDGVGVFECAGFRISFTGVAATSFAGTMKITRTPSRDLLVLDSYINAFKETEWDSEYEPYRDATMVTQRIAAFTLNALKRVLE